MPRRAAPTVRLYGPRLLVRDFRRTWKFYRQVVGLTPAPGHGEPPYGEFVQGRRAILGLFAQDLMAVAMGLEVGVPNRRSTGPTVLVFEVPDVDRTARRLRARRVPVVRGPTDRPEWGLRTVHLRDPDGRLVELFTRIRP